MPPTPMVRRHAITFRSCPATRRTRSTPATHPIGQMTYDMFNLPLTNSLNGTVDPLTRLNACPIAPTDQNNQVAVGVIIVCPQFESDGKTPSPLVGQAIVRNLMPGRFGVTVH